VTDQSKPKKPAKSEWAAHFWEGCDVRAWWTLLAQNQFRVHWSKLYIAASVTFVSVGHTILRWMQDVLYGKTIRNLTIQHAPVFIVGHWRSGTTFLHELLIADPRHAFPTTYECFAPHHFLITESWLPKWTRWMMPSRRPMDNMSAGWDRPQEDEFAMCLLGRPSPYAKLAFPNSAQGEGLMDLSALSPGALADWKRTFLRLVRELTVRHGGRRLILKSPPHSCRIRTLLELFPDARFIHIIRDPHVLYASTLKLWRTLYTTQGLQLPTFAGLEEQVLANFAEMYRCIQRDRSLVREGRWFEMRYEDLVREPLPILERLYANLELGDFAAARLGIEKYLAGVHDYAPNKHIVSGADRALLAERWGTVIRHYGYDRKSADK
jgi:omega-hydroxy-beta-dihydromenaquinone-9 sulfotransferase